jgi:8-oxo-dGTP pyrophosphatase MutT (NUDIX family)
MPAGMNVHSKNVMSAINKHYTDMILTKWEYKEFTNIDDYNFENKSLIDFIINNKIDLAHIEFDFGYYGFDFGCVPFVDLINLFKQNNIEYTLSIHNPPETFIQSMKVLNKDVKKFSEVIDYLNKEPDIRKIVHNPLFLGHFAPLLPVKENFYQVRDLDFKNKEKIIIGIVGFLHKAKGYEDLFKFAKKYKDLFVNQNILIKALFFMRGDRKTPDRLEYKKFIEGFNDSHISIQIIDENLDAYCSFFNEIDVGFSTHCTLTESATITDYVYYGLPVIAKEHFNLLYLDFILMYNNWDTLYGYISNIRKTLMEYDFNKQRSFCNIFNSEYVATKYRLAFIKNGICSFKHRPVVGCLCYYNGKQILFKKNNVPFFDIMHGGIEKNETDKKALEREIFEELGLTSDQIIIKEKICSFEYSKPIKLQIKVSNKGSKMNIYYVELKELPKLPTIEIESYSVYFKDLLIYESTRALLNTISKT